MRSSARPGNCCAVRLNASPIYLRFLCGERELTCAAWANPTYNVRGWRGPCYLVSDAHYETYRELVEATDWDRLGPGGDLRGSLSGTQRLRAGSRALRAQGLRRRAANGRVADDVGSG